MSMSTSDKSADVFEVIDLEPSPDPEFDGLRAAMASTSSETLRDARPIDPAPSSASGEMRALRRDRLAATALLLTFAFATLLVWHLSYRSSHGPYTWGLFASRLVLCTVVAAVLVSPIRLAVGQVRMLEIVLFGGLTAIVVLAQYFVSLEVLEREKEIGLIAFMKNGVIQMVTLILMYGTLIPNRPRTVAWVVVLMAAAPLFSHAFLSENPHFAAFSEKMSAAEFTGSNALFLLLAAIIATFSSILLNGLRIELHRARKFGKYRLIRKLGEGGMGEVYLAEHLLLKRPCALKLIKRESGSNPIALARFEREVQSAARLSHPNTIEIYDYGHTSDGTFYYVMEYLQGLSLSELVRRDGPLLPGRVIYIFRQVCAGLAEAHRLGLVHRDLKPGNLFLAVRGGEADVAKVLDFGLVKLTQDPGAVEISRELTVSGTPMYMAPEQATADRSLDSRADIYALGAMMYFALTGSPPFTGESGFAIMMSQVRDPVVPPSERIPGLPADLEEVVLRCLAKKPSDRYPSVRALGDALAECTSASEWGPNRAEAWWTSEGLEVS